MLIIPAQALRRTLSLRILKFSRFPMPTNGARPTAVPCRRRATAGVRDTTFKMGLKPSNLRLYNIKTVASTAALPVLALYQSKFTVCSGGPGPGPYMAGWRQSSTSCPGVQPGLELGHTLVGVGGAGGWSPCQWMIAENSIRNKNARRAHLSSCYLVPAGGPLGVVCRWVHLEIASS